MAAKSNKHSVDSDRDRNPDPITDAPGAHPVGVGIGAAVGGAAAGAAAGAVGGPVGVVAGAAIGAVAGGYAGKAAAEAIDPTVESAYWRENYSKRPYYDPDMDYDDYEPAYRYGWESRVRYPEQRFEDIEPDLEAGWPDVQPTSQLGWSKARHATRDAWDRIDQTAWQKGENPGQASHKPR